MFTCLKVPTSILKRDYPLMLVSLLIMIGFSGLGPALFHHLDLKVAFLVLGLLIFTIQAIRSEKVDLDEGES